MFRLALQEIRRSEHRGTCRAVYSTQFVCFGQAGEMLDPTALDVSSHYPDFCPLLVFHRLCQSDFCHLSSVIPMRRLHAVLELHLNCSSSPLICKKEKYVRDQSLVYFWPTKALHLAYAR